jgi:hypothetical protein
MANMQETEDWMQEYIRKYGYVNLGGGLSEQYAEEIISNPHIDTVQISKPISERSWTLLNDTILTERKDIWIRVYGFYATVCDLKFLNLIPRVEKLSIDSIDDSINIESISELQFLKALNLQVYDLKSFDLIADIGESITDLRLGRTKSKKPNLAFLQSYKNLKNLSIHGHKKHLHIIGELSKLESLSLAGITVDNFNFLGQLPLLVELFLDLVKCEDFCSLKDLNLKGFGLSEIRGMTDLSFISHLKKLQCLSLSSLNKVTTLPEFMHTPQLKRVFIENMKALEKISTLFNCTQLVDLIFRMDSTNLTPRDFEPLVHMKELKFATIGTGSVKKNEQIDKLLTGKNINQYYDFEYQ